MKLCNIDSNTYVSFYKSFIKFNKEKKRIKSYEITDRTTENMSDRLSFSTPFVDALLNLTKDYGVYALVNSDDIIIYIGVSKTLGNRIKESYIVTPNAKGFRHIKTKSLSDAYILEVLMINTLKPLHNKGTLGHDEVSFKVPKNYDIDSIKTIWN